MLTSVVVGAAIGALVGGLFSVVAPKAKCLKCGRTIAKAAKKCPRCRASLEKGWAGN